MERSVRSTAETDTGLHGDLFAVRVERTEVAPALVRLLEVVGDELVVLLAVTRLVDDPSRGTLVELGARRLEHPPVRGIADQDVVEAKEWLVDPARASRLEQLLAPQCFEDRTEPGAHGGRKELA